jgi:hypothetical protein
MTLAEDLVIVTAHALSSTATARGYRLADEREPLARAAVVALLRGLATEQDTWRPEELAALADDIEGGAA